MKLKVEAQGRNEYGAWKRMIAVQTNGDKFRGKSDRQLAELMATVTGCPINNCMTRCPDGHAPNEDCNAVNCWFDWLKQEAEG